MRVLFLILSLSLTNTSMAESANPHENVRNLQPSPAPEASESGGGVTDTSADWEAEYLAGQKLRGKGVRMGLIGLTGAVAGIAMYTGGQDFDASGAIGVSGFLVMWAGSGVSAWGTSVERRALVRAGAVQRGCIGCVAAWGTAIYGMMFPVSYIISSTQSASNRRIYRNVMGQGGGDLSFHISPMPTPSGMGLGLNGTF